MPAKKEAVSQEAANQAKSQALRKRIAEAVDGLKFGQVVIVIKDGKVTQLDRTEKQRFTGVEGIYGDGI
ncbi:MULTISPECIES: YezD family protein [Propionispora]|uniref:Uncharacterized small protein n=2 Tax=Propionispora TaxID=112902 RepID=A0A1H8WIW5_9FIRM|nr:MULTISPECIES: YezD family protein [Propionispora]SEP27549.1 Uncharacterized small protein [Propionispora vibrioides]SHI83434.1 Uncharacterized small protein [Propionispora hippei DSM 15287]